MEHKAERDEARAERYDIKSAKAIETGKALQKPIDDMHGDIAFFTQPNINSSASRAFSNKRDRMFAAWEKVLRYSGNLNTMPSVQKSQKRQLI